MRLSRSVSVSLSSKRKHGSRVRKKHKLLNAICEDVYNQNHGFSAQSSGKNSGVQQESNALELRRSSRVRRSPVVLDASPPPVKKRKKLGKNDEKLLQRNTKEKDRDRGSLPNDNNSEGSDEKGGWRSRLRSRIRNLGVSPRGKRKLFEDLNDVKKAKVKGAKEDGIEFGELTAPRSKRPRRTKASLMVGHDDEREMEPPVVAEEACERTDAEVALKMEAKNAPRMRNGLNSENDNVSVVNNNESIDREKSGGPNDMPLDEFVDANVDAQVQFDEGLKQFECRREEDQGVAPEVGCKQLEDRPCHGRTNATLAIPSEEHVLDEGVMKVSEITRTSSTTLVKSRIKEGRLCGLCGGGTDGKPPRRLVQDAGESENEVCSGYSASEESSYDIWDGFGDEPGWLGRLLGPINDRYGIAGIWVHQLCAVWSPEVYFAGLGCLKNVRAALCRGRALRCTRCRRPGATIGCRVDRCPKTYHLACARANGCIFDHRKFLIACTDHRHIFLPHGNQYLMRINKMKAKKMKLEMRKLSNDACRKDLEAEEKWLENCGEDEEFLKRESKRLHRDMLRIAPVYIGGSDAENGGLLRGWESVVGLQDVIRCMKEVVILPLLYPEFFSNLGLTPPRGVLLHGYPGTGKTLVVRALIGACSRGDKRIAYFARKGADCLGKYVGDAERQLRLLFQVAERCQPSIIFFDEIDGLAPQRTRHQDQTHSSVVSTLLALLDGLKSRGSVVVIGATNRPEAVDPALRRPGRFDREIHFPLPSVKDRASILSLHTQKWPKPIAGSVLNWIAKRTCGFAGADLQALCTQAAMIALKRNFPLHELLSAVEKEVLDGNHVPLPSFAVEERDWLEALSCAPPPCSRRESGMAGNDVTSSPLPAHLIPCLLPPLSKLLVSLYLDERLCLPSPISRAAKVIKGIIVLNLKKKKMLFDCWWLHVDNLIQEENIAKEIEKKLTCAGILVGESSFSGSDAPTDGNDESEDLDSPKMPHDNGYSTRVLHSKSFLYGRKTGFRILIAGDPKLGQRHLASCLLYFFSGNAEIQKVDLATILQEGRGDTVQGLTQILMKCAHAQSCVLFMPRIDLWAVGKNSQDDKEDFDSISSSDRLSEQGFNLASWQAAAGDIVSHVKKNEPSEKVDNSDSCRSASHTWSLFLEQVDTLCVSASLMILATSEAPYPELPGRVRQFFKQDSPINGHPGPTEHNVPQFLLQVEESFNPDMVISSSAAELSRDVVKLFVQLLHHRTHGDSKPCKYFKSRHDGEGRIKVASKHERRTESPVQVPNSKSIKGKSNLLLAIYTFGYQLLRYPHFAELCWVTSKLKDGPCADINGPWKDKGWPFNSCIIRPGNGSSEKVPLGGSFGNGKGKEKFGLVRGLIAVGLSAYRGVYTSSREVSFEVRKVLELLVAQINTKILAGKDRCQFVRLLSQVACLEDMVNSWAHTLQSLEPDSHAPRAGSDADKLVQSEECKLSEVTPKDRNQKLAEENFREVPTTRNVDPAPSEAEIATPAEGPLQPMALSCSYHCCSDCLRVLHDSMLKLLTHRWKRSTNKKTIEDVHDDISSFSASLLSSLRRAHVAGKAFGPEASFAKLQNCACHAMEEFSTEEGEGQTNTQSGVGMRIIYKDGVVVPLDPENDVPFHCRYETLCLCSLIDWIITKNNL